MADEVAQTPSDSADKSTPDVSAPVVTQSTDTAAPVSGETPASSEATASADTSSSSSSSNSSSSSSSSGSSSSSSPAQPSPRPTRKRKRPQTAYFLFCAKHRAEVVASHPKEGLGSIAKILGRKWTALTDAEKKPFYEEAAAAKALYQKELAELGPIEVSVGDCRCFCLPFVHALNYFLVRSG